MGMKVAAPRVIGTRSIPQFKAGFIKRFPLLLLKCEDSSQKLRFRTQLVHKTVPGGFAVILIPISCKEQSEISCKVQVKLALGAYLLKHPLRSCGFEACVPLVLEVLQKIDKLVHQVVIAELVGQDKGWQEVLLDEIVHGQILICSLGGRKSG
jgi:hypothetical protein